jgi:hypothetical protein
MSSNTREGWEKRFDRELKVPGVWNSDLITPKKLGGTFYDVLDPIKVKSFIRITVAQETSRAVEEERGLIMEKLEELKIVGTIEENLGKYANFSKILDGGQSFEHRKMFRNQLIDEITSYLKEKSTSDKNK